MSGKRIPNTCELARFISLSVYIDTDEYRYTLAHFASVYAALH